jgi:hypothetical protein
VDGQAALWRDRGLRRHPLRASLLARRLRLRPFRVRRPVPLHGFPQLCSLPDLVIWCRSPKSPDPARWAFFDYTPLATDRSIRTCWDTSMTEVCLRFVFCWASNFGSKFGCWCAVGTGAKLRG